MAPRGRPPKPTEQKRREGNPGKRALPIPAGSLPAAIGVPLVPDGLTPYASDRWALIWRAGGSWLSPDLDAPTVEIVCRTYDECAQLRRLLDEHGMLLEEPIATPSGKPVVNADGTPAVRLTANPAAKMLRAAEKQLEGWLSDLGFSPTARARLGLAEVKRQSVLQELLAKRAGG